MSASPPIAAMAAACRAANAAALRWMLDRPALGPGFVNTKVNSLTLADYGSADGWRAPAMTYGWIQGRALEALFVHRDAFAADDPALAADLDRAGRRLAAALSGLRDPAGHAYFCYDAAMVPVRPGDAGEPVPQERPADVWTYSDAFVAKGLVAAAAAGAAVGPLDRRLDDLAAVVAAIEAGRFQMDEKAPLGDAALARQAEDFGPRMILLGAGGLLRRVGRPDRAGFADRFVAHVLDRHFDPATGLVANVPGEDVCNVGHAVEFVGFALDHFGPAAPPDLVATLERILLAAFAAGFVGPGIALTVSRRTGRATSALCPWWSLPEAVRAAALLYEHTRSEPALAVWRRAHDAFFGTYWRGAPPIAYQTMTAEGPVDFVPATPDLDPGYHTGLSLLAAIEVADRLG